MYKVIKYFIDLQDKNHEYHEGDVFPREGLEVTEQRIAELSSRMNRRHEPLIAEEKQPEAEQPAEEEKPEAEQPAEEEKPAKKPAAKKK